MLGVRSGSITLILQIIPLASKVVSNVPPNWSTDRDSSRVPNPRWVGVVTTLKTAKTLGIDIPTSLLAAANEVIE
jgi:hypothetical protein